MYNEITSNAFANVPEEILAHDAVREAIQYVDSWADEFDRWIDPESDYYAMELHDAERDGAVAVAERYRDMLADALYRQDVLGIQFDLGRFIEGLSVIELDAVLSDAR